MVAYKTSVKAAVDRRKYSVLLPMSLRMDMAEKLMLSAPQTPCPVYHHFGPGIYIREMHIPAGTLVMGHEHTGDSSNIFLKGRLKLLQEDGSWQELTAPMFMVGGPGRKAAITLEDCIWQNIFATNETDLKVLEATLVRKSEAFLKYEQELTCPSQPPQLA